jgi:hypothetical protein
MKPIIKTTYRVCLNFINRMSEKLNKELEADEK